ncbi:sulfatase-like hydrolase/transferase [bacterium]|nr:sulfatase-like hydrolase/transferase [bacterium]
MKKIKWYEYLTPLVLALFPILSLAQANIIFVQLTSIVRPILIALIVAGVLFSIFNSSLQRPRKAALLSGLLIFMLLTYGNAYMAIQNRFDVTLSHWILLAIFAALFLGIGALIVYKVKDAQALNQAVLFGVLAIVVYLLVSIGIYQYRVYNSETAADVQAETVPVDLSEDELAALPDIYVILLDGHTRSDILRDVYRYTNTPFVNELEDLGFWVADCSTSNYPGTYFSTASMFGMDYLHNIYDETDNLVFPPLSESRVFQTLTGYQYQTVTFENFVFEHFNINNDLRFGREDTVFGSISEFEKLVVDTSILRILVDHPDAFPERWVRAFDDDFYLQHYRDTTFALETLPTIPEIEGRKFVFAHLLVTHDPFVFLPDGSFTPSRTITRNDYINAVEFIDGALPGILAEIIENTENPPIIIVMGDHGAIVKGRPVEERMANLFAIYLQGQDPTEAGFYEDISLVNVFRLLNNYLFDSDYALLEDQSYAIWNNTEIGNLDLLVETPCAQ